MAIMQYRPATDVLSPLFEEMLSRPQGGGRMSNLLRAPEADVVETETEIRVLMEMPGMKADEITIDLENNVLSVSGEKREEREKEDDRHTWHLSERRYGQFSRSFVLPRDVEADRIQAHFADGVLRVTIPKSERARRRKIEVRSDGGQQRVETGAGN